MHNQIITQPTQDQQVTYQSNLFLEHIGKTKSPATFKTYASNLSAFKAWWHSNPIQSGLKSHLEAYKSHVAMKYPSSRSKNLQLSVVRNLFKYLYEAGELDQDYAKHLKNFKVSDGHAKSALDKYQLHDLLLHIKTISPRNQVLMYLALSNGLRINEMVNINIEDISQKDGDHIIWLLRKGYSDKSCYTILLPGTFNAIANIVGNRASGHLFASNKGGALTTTSVSKIIKKTLRDAGIDQKEITAHSLRHTAARLWLEAGVNITQIMTALNHKHLSSTQIYARAYDRHSKAAEKSVNIYDM